MAWQVQRLAELVERVPVLGTIYSATRQLLEAVFSSRAQSFQRVVLVEFPRKGCYCLGFLTAEAWEGVQTAVGAALVSVFVPTTSDGFTPNGMPVELTKAVRSDFRMG